MENRPQKEEEGKWRSHCHEGRWTVSTWLRETASIWGTPLGEKPVQQLEQLIRDDLPVTVKAKEITIVLSLTDL